MFDVTTLANSIVVKLDKADAYAAAAKEKTDEAHVAREKARNLRISAGIELAHAQQRVKEAGDMTWVEWCKQHVPGRSERSIRQILRLGKSDDPIAEDQQQRDHNAQRVQKHRHYKDDVTPDPEVDRDCVRDAKLLFRRFSFDERAAFLKWVKTTGLY